MSETQVPKEAQVAKQVPSKQAAKPAAKHITELLNEAQPLERESPIAPIEPIPEPPAPMPKELSQDILRVKSIEQNNVKVRGEMVPNTTPPETHPSRHQYDSEEARAASLSRLAKEYDWEESDIDEALRHLANLRAETEKGGAILERRISQIRIEKVKCYGCDNIIDVTSGHFAGSKTRNNFETGRPETVYACSARCFLAVQRDFIHPMAQRG